MATRTAGQGNLCYSEAKDSKLLNEGSGGRGWGVSPRSTELRGGVLCRYDVEFCFVWGEGVH